MPGTPTAPPQERPVLPGCDQGAGTFLWTLRVYWEDTDAGGIVFYANYLKFFERARTEWLRSLGVEQQRLREQTGGMFVVSSTAVQYHQPARLDDRLQVSARIAELGRASMTLLQEAWLLRGDQPTRQLCEGSIRIGWVQADTLRPARIPPTVYQLLQTR